MRIEFRFSFPLGFTHSRDRLIDFADLELGFGVILYLKSCVDIKSVLIPSSLHYCQIESAYKAYCSGTAQAFFH